MADLINQEAEVQPIRITAGDDFIFTARIKADGVAQDLTGWDIVSQIKDKSTGDLLGTLEIGSGITLLPAIGDALVVVPALITEELRTRKCLVMDIQTVNTEGYKRTYIKITMTGAIDITQL